MVATTHGNKLVLDTCVIINILENRSVADLIKCHIDTENCRVYLNSVSLDEASRKGYGKKQLVSKISEYLDTLVIVKEVTNENYIEAQKLEDNCSLIHHGDSAIAAFSVENKSTLVTYDKELLKGCNVVGIPVFNPDMPVA